MKMTPLAGVRATREYVARLPFALWGNDSGRSPVRIRPAE